jgi:hypothetical protein
MHSIKEANINKKDRLHSFIKEYDRIKWWFVDYLWNTKISWAPGRVLDITNCKFDCPAFISTVNIPYHSELSARAIKLASGEALGIVKSQTEKRRRQIYILSKKMREGDVSGIKKLQSKIDSNPLIQPRKNKTDSWINLDSNCCEFMLSKDHSFDGFLVLKSLGKKYGTIRIPIKFTKHSNKLSNNSFELMTAWAISQKYCTSRWTRPINKSSGTKIVGADQGYTTCLSLSDSQATTKCSHGHDLASIIQGMSRKEKGSKAFKRAQEHRTNYINWSINQLDLSDVCELRLEKLFQMRKGVNMGSHLSKWTYTEINAQIKSRCDIHGVRVVEQSATYRSQRCSDCGWTQKINRKRKEFICRECGSVHDADMNGALNHEADLYRLPINFWQSKMNVSGFFWLETGIFDRSGQEITVLDVKKLKT